MYFVAKTPLGEFTSVVYDNKEHLDRAFSLASNSKTDVIYFKARCEDGGTFLVVLRNEILNNSVFCFYN